MCTYEHLVDATLPHGLMPLVVPQLKTITLGGAVTGLGHRVERRSATACRTSPCIEMDILTGDGEIVTATPDGEHADLFAAFPNSYGSLGYAVRLRIELEPVHAVRRACATSGSTTSTSWPRPSAAIVAERALGRRARRLPRRRRVLRRRVLPDPRPLDRRRRVVGLLSPSDYTGQQIYYRSLRERTRDVLTAHDYIWRWDTDWFWCSGAFGAQNPRLRRIWPAKWRRSDFYYRIVGLENRFQVKARIDRAPRRAAQGARRPRRRDPGRAAPPTSCAGSPRNVGMTPVWLCPLKLRETDGAASARTWPLYPLQPGQVYVNVGFWGLVADRARAGDGDVNRAIEQTVAEHGGHKSLYSDAYYDEDDVRRDVRRIDVRASRRRATTPISG